MTEAISIKQVYEELKRIEKQMVTKKEIEALIETLAVLKNPETMMQLRDSANDKKYGKVKKVNSAKDLLKER